MERLVASIAASGLIASLLLGVPAAAADDERVEGSWYITVQVTEPSPATFDALYGFAKGGVLTRIDGRNNASALGTWKRTEDGGIIFSNILFNFTDGARAGYHRRVCRTCSRRDADRHVHGRGPRNPRLSPEEWHLRRDTDHGQSP
jgi:hypothetical protein